MVETAIDVENVFREVQEATSKQSSVKLAKALWNGISSCNFFRTLQNCLFRLIIAPEQTSSVNKGLTFFNVLIKSAPKQCSWPSDELLSFVKQLQHFVHGPQAICRFRSLHVLLSLIESPDMQIASLIGKFVRSDILQRLNDKSSKVRRLAIDLLAKCTCNNAQDGVEALIGILERESNQVVLTAALRSLPCCEEACHIYLRYSRHQSEEIRKVVYLSLRDRPSAMSFSTSSVASLLGAGLTDASPNVRQAAQEFLSAWFEDELKSDPLKLLQLIDVDDHAEEASLALTALIQASVFKPTAYMRAHTHQSFRGNVERRATKSTWELMGSKESFLWRTLCVWCASQAAVKGVAAARAAGAVAQVQVASASELQEALEAALPDSPYQLLELLSNHATRGPSTRFAASQMIMTASKCVDWSDATSRQAASEVLRTLISLDPRAEAQCTQPSLPSCTLAGNGGSGIWEDAIMELMASVYPDTYEFSAQWITFLGSASQTWRMRQEEIDPSQHTQSLAFVLRGLQKLPLTKELSAHLTVEDDASGAPFLENLILSGLQQTGATRCLAVKCLGMLCLFSDTKPKLPSYVPRLVSAAQQGTDAAATAAVSVLGDLAATWGPGLLPSTGEMRGIGSEGVNKLQEHGVSGLREPGCLDACVLDEITGRLAAAGLDDGAGRDTDSLVDQAASTTSMPAESNDSAHDQILQLLVSKLHQCLEHVKSESSGKSGARKKTAGESKKLGSCRTGVALEYQNLMAAIVEALAKILLHQQQHLNLRGGASSHVQEVELVNVLRVLLLVEADSVTQQCPRMSQCLGLFFQVYVRASPAYRRLMSTAYPLALNQALEDHEVFGRLLSHGLGLLIPDDDSKVESQDAVASSLLQLAYQVASGYGPQADSKTATKKLVTELCKGVQYLSIKSEEREAIEKLAARASCVLDAVSGNSAACKALHAFLHELEGNSPGLAVSAERVDEERELLEEALS